MTQILQSLSRKQRLNYVLLNLSLLPSLWRGATRIVFMQPLASGSSKSGATLQKSAKLL